MLEEYLRYWGLKKPPFSLTPDPEMMYMSQQHRECLLRLQYAVGTNKGGALLTSDNAGDGKTSILYKLIEEVKREFGEKSHIAFISHPVLAPSEMLWEIGRQLGTGEPSRQKIRNINAIRDFLLLLHAEGAKSIVVVDEGQMLTDKPDVLEELRTLLNFCVSDSFLLTFIFSGQKPLEGAIKSRPEFWQRLPVRYFLRNLDEEDTGELVRHRMRKAGAAEGEIFTEEALIEIYRHSRGCPRVICSIADMALVVGFARRTKEIEGSEVLQAVADMQSGGGDAFLYYHFLETRKRPLKATEAARRQPPPRRAAARKDTACLTLRRRLELLPFFSRLTESLPASINGLIAPGERKLFYLPEGGLKGKAVLQGGSGKGFAGKRGRCAVLVTDRAVCLIVGKRAVRLPIVQLLPPSLEGRRAVGKGIVVMETRDRRYQLRLRFSPVQAEALADALLSYLAERRQEMGGKGG